jgi:uncharacterized OsmC-like protein
LETPASKRPYSLVRERQDPLRRRYRTAPEDASIIDKAVTLDREPIDPLHGWLDLGDGYGANWRFGIHRAVGGFHDEPNPGDLLCGAVAACQDSTLRMLADRLGIKILGLSTRVTGEVDVRGALAVEASVPVGFQQLHCRLELRVPEGTDPALIQRLLAGAERSCVVLQTVRNGVPIHIYPNVVKG